MRDIIYLRIFDGFADAPLGLALSELARPRRWQLQTVAEQPGPVQAMSGLRVLPDRLLSQFEPSRAALCLLPGGHHLPPLNDLWRENLRQAHAGGSPLAAIDRGVLSLAETGLLDEVRHTGPSPAQLGAVAGYRGAAGWRARPAIRAQRLITAQLSAPVEFALEIIHALDLYDSSDASHWYRLHKHGVPLPWMRRDPALVAAGVTG